MPSGSVDLLVIGGGIHGVAIARDAAGRGLRVYLAEKGDYACATSSASSKLVHGGLRYLEHWDLGLVREALTERAELLRTAPYLVWPLKFLVPVYDWQPRKAWVVRAGLALYDLLSFGDGFPPSGRLSRAEMAALPDLKRENLRAVLHYHDAQTDDARLTVNLALDARARGADILNRRTVTALAALDNGYVAEIDERGARTCIGARFVVNAAGPFASSIDAMTATAPALPPPRLVRGSHIVLPMPDPADACAYTLQDDGERVVFVIPWLENRFRIVGTTDVPHEGDPEHVACSPEETAYLLAAYNRYFAGSRGPPAPADVVYTWSGLRALHGGPDEVPSRISRSPAIAARAQGTGGLVTILGGKLTTHRALAEEVLARIGRMGLAMGAPWTKNAPFYGGNEGLPALFGRADAGPDTIARDTRRRWARTYGSEIEALFARLRADGAGAEEIAPGVPRAELEYAAETEDAMTAEDFLLRRTKLHLFLNAPQREAIAQWFATA